jgi:hypothetical protein
VIDGRDGGKIVYGVMEHTSPAGAMGSVLRYVHHAFGEPPLVGKVFQSRDGQNFGAFFTVTAKSQGNKAIRGPRARVIGARDEGRRSRPLR